MKIYMKKIIINESQLRNVVKEMVNEAHVTGTDFLTVNFGTIWPMGKWKLNNNQVKLIEQKINEINKYIADNKNSKITIQIESGESQVTNKDMEVSPPLPLEPGVLAKRRGEVVVDYLKRYFNNQIGKFITKEQFPNILEPKVVIGQTPYTKGSNDLRDRNKVKMYQQEQHVKALVSIESQHECVVGLNLTVGYFPGRNKSKHNCDEAIFLLKMNDTNIGVVNLNNGKVDVSYSEWDGNLDNPPMMLKIKAKRKNMDPKTYVTGLKSISDKLAKLNRKTDNQEGGMRSQSFVINEQMARTIPNNTDRINLTLTPLVSPKNEYSPFYENGNHTESPWVSITNPKTKKVLYNGEPNIGFKRGSLSETLLLTLDACGKPITTKKETK